MLPKNFLPLLILEVLKNHSASGAPLTQAEIERRLDEDYGYPSQRAAIGRNLKELEAAGFPLRSAKTAGRKDKSGEAQDMHIGWYYIHEFTGGELRFLTDTVSAMRHIPKAQHEQLLAKVTALSNLDRQQRLLQADLIPDEKYDAKANDFFGMLEKADRAIAEGKQLRFSLNRYNMQKQLAPDPRAEAFYFFSPYRTAAADGTVYLIGHLQDSEGLCHFRLDKLDSLTKTSRDIVPLQEVTGADTLDLQAYLRDKLYFSAPPGTPAADNVLIQFQAPRDMLDTIIDTFGTGIDLHPEDGKLDIKTIADENAFRAWVKPYEGSVTVLRPKVKPKSSAKQAKQPLLRSRFAVVTE
ncbi:MAG: WYL domain-containing protein [Oscillospiraceae bacterium]|jgi:hypothetical protein|nr:WYL domain-containing protein [Oscillospiraceae bacterium]